MFIDINGFKIVRITNFGFENPTCIALDHYCINILVFTAQVVYGKTV